ncbi:MAG: UDP-2,3-diacylglucosamine diphosphatase [Chromatiales bacterium]|nr:MAG: UDP-2,3-diacylglucosamine diphosphatase [Chromatiales bacterium]
MATLFISDLHLEPGRPEIGEQFLAFLTGPAREANALYILGDLFEAWIGDDDPNPYYGQMKSAIRELADSGVPVFFMHGNRDFMIGKQFAAEAGVRLLDDPHSIELHGENVLLSHGDAMCTDDVEYQTVRAMTRNPDWQAMMLSKSIEERVAFAVQAREQSLARGESMTEEISDVNQEAVEQTLRDSGADILLHGHTHRPAVHPFHVDDRPVHRIVLGDWYEQGSMVVWDEDGPRLEELPRK